MDKTVPIRFGRRIRLRHVNTQAFLRSSGKIFGHPGSSRQQMVVAGREYDEAAVWVVKRAHGWRGEDTSTVKQGDIIRLEHSVTHANLHSHDAPAPINRDQQEVTCFGSEGTGDPNDNWRVEIVSGEVWSRSDPVRLVHVLTGKHLHSHSSSHPILTDGYHEVTAVAERDDNDLWSALPMDAESSYTPSVEFGQVKGKVELPAALVRAVVNLECVLFAGAGLSVNSGLPGWADMVSEMLSQACKRGWFDDNYALGLRQSLEAGNVTMVADAILTYGASNEDQRGGGLDGIMHQIRVRLAPPQLRISRVHEMLREIPFRAALTTNFDCLLEKTFQDARILYHSDSAAVLEALNQPEFFVLHLYGSIEKTNSIVISRLQYEEALAQNRLLAKAIENLFVSRTLLFLGASLDGIADFLNGLRFQTSREREHFALLAVRDESWRVRADALKRRYNITVIPYNSTEGHSYFPALVERLAHKVKLHARSSASAKPRKSRLFLRKVRLQNVGPYDDLTLELNHGWNVLLGDNGVGKSSIIRAIAVGFLGRDAGDAAARLIKQGSSHARIELETDERQYVTELFASDGPVEIVSSATPLAAEGWLALGFPALRSLRWTSCVANDAKFRKRPVATDLLPLLENEPDPRTEEFKGWLAKSEVVSSSLPLLSRLNEILRALTPGLDLRISEVDAQKGHVFVKSHQDMLRIECVSQGTASILGWVGVLLQRQAEIHGLVGNVAELPAFLLIDEVDAHMHPAWQRSLIPTMTKIFPNLQLLATTHSSLIVSSLEPEQVTVLRRGPSGLAKIRPTTGLQGLRADQILTSEVFGLADTVDPETQQWLDRYADLLSLTECNQEQETELAKMAELLRLRVPSPSQRKEARKAAELIRAFMVERMREKPSADQEQVMREVRVQLSNALAGNNTMA